MTKREMDDHMQRARELLEDAMGCAIEHNLSGQVSMRAALDAIAAALRSKSAQAVPEGWQPIGTAPDDIPADDAVIICITYDEQRFAGQRMVGEAFRVDGVWWWAGFDPMDYHSDPIEDMYGLGCVTHWMPLPEPPDAAPKPEQGA